MNHYSDLRAAGINNQQKAYEHWIRFGQYEGRIPRSMGHPLGINVIGFIRGDLGLGDGVRSIIRALKTTSIPYSLYCVNLEPHRNQNREWESEITNELRYKINLIAVQADTFHLIPNFPALLQNRINITLQAWELESYPSQWKESLMRFHEFWAYSQFNRDVIAHTIPEKEVIAMRVPSSQELTPYDSTPDRLKYGISTSTCVILFIFDGMSSVERKNPSGVISAFQDAFTEDDDVLLIIKTHNYNGSYTSHSKIWWINQNLPKSEVYTLINMCDIYISLHRSEGLGLTMFEAMMLGKPVVATGYSGNVDFMNSENSCLVDYTLVSSTGNYYGRFGCRWAEPNISTASQYLRRLYHDPAWRKEMGMKARDYLLEEWTYQKLGQKIQERYDLIISAH